VGAGNRVHLLEKGAGPPIVLLHGAANPAGFLLPLLRKLHGVQALIRREYHPARQTPASSSFVLGRRTPASGDGPGRAGGLRALQLDPGSGRMVPVTRVGRSALRAAAPAG
jgi:hypothetical protein